MAGTTRWCRRRMSWPSQELTASGADWQIHGYGNTLHAFTNPEANAPDMGAMYQEDADRRSWQAMENFLAEVLA